VLKQLDSRDGCQPYCGYLTLNVTGSECGAKKGSVINVSRDHPMPSLANALNMRALGTADPDFYDGLLGQLVNPSTQGKEPDERGVNFMMSMIRGIAPKDEVESMMAAQMAAVHIATMTFARRLAHVDNIPQQDSAERAFNKLARTFAARARFGGSVRHASAYRALSRGFGQGLSASRGFGASERASGYRTVDAPGHEHMSAAGGPRVRRRSG
jgi:hypothetical protein